MDPMMDMETVIIEYEYFYDEDEDGLDVEEEEGGEETVEGSLDTEDDPDQEENQGEGVEETAEGSLETEDDPDQEDQDEAVEETEKGSLVTEDNPKGTIFRDDTGGLLQKMLSQLGQEESGKSTKEEADSEKLEDEVDEGEKSQDEAINGEVSEEVTDEVIEDGPNGRRVVKSRKFGRGPRPAAHGLLEMMLSEGFDLGELFKGRPRRKTRQPNSGNLGSASLAGNSNSRGRRRRRPQHRRKRLLKPEDFAQERFSSVESAGGQHQPTRPKVYSTTIVHDAPDQLSLLIPTVYLERPRARNVIFPATAVGNSNIGARGLPAVQRPFAVPTSIIGKLIFHSQNNAPQAARVATTQTHGQQVLLMKDGSIP